MFGADRALPGVDVVRVDPGQLDGHLPQQVFELVDRPAVERRGRDDVVAGCQEREEGRRLCGDAAGEGDRAAAAFEVRHALLEHGDRRVHDARVGVAVLLEVEVGGRRFGVLEDVAGRLENRHRAGAGIGIGPLPGVHLPGLEPELTGLFHRALSSTGGQTRVRPGLDRGQTHQRWQTLTGSGHRSGRSRPARSDPNCLSDPVCP